MGILQGQEAGHHEVYSEAGYPPPGAVNPCVQLPLHRSPYRAKPQRLVFVSSSEKAAQRYSSAVWWMRSPETSTDLTVAGLPKLSSVPSGPPGGHLPDLQTAGLAGES